MPPTPTRSVAEMPRDALIRACAGLTLEQLRAQRQAWERLTTTRQVADGTPLDGEAYAPRLLDRVTELQRDGLSEARMVAWLVEEWVTRGWGRQMLAQARFCAPPAQLTLVERSGDVTDAAIEEGDR